MKANRVKMTCFARTFVWFSELWTSSIQHIKIGEFVSMRATPEQSQVWLRARMNELGVTSLDELARRCGSDKGNLSRVFRQIQSPRVDALEPLAAGLEIGVYELLVRIGVVDPDEDTPPVVRKSGQRVTFTWPS